MVLASLLLCKEVASLLLSLFDCDVHDVGNLTDCVVLGFVPYGVDVVVHCVSFRWGVADVSSVYHYTHNASPNGNFFELFFSEQ